MNEEFEKQQPEQEAHASAIPEISPIPEVTPVEVPTVSTEETETENDVAETETAAVSAPTEEKEEYPNPFAPQNQPAYPATPPYAPQGQPNYRPQYAPQGQPNYPPQYAPQSQPNYPPQYAPQGQPTTIPASRKTGQVIMWIAAILIEAIIVGFAIYGIYALCTRDAQPQNPPTQSQGPNLQIPSRPNNDNNTSSGSNSIRENSSKVQMGIICFELPEEYLQMYDIEAGLVVQSFASDSPAKEAGLKEGDVITAMNGKRVTTFDELDAIMADLEPGDKITLTCYRMFPNGNTFKPGEPFEVTFNVQEKHDEVSSYPGA